jgi:Lrp/AsnC family leucine-responsive transcriptional regulator
MNLDVLDSAILRALQEDCSVTHAALASEVNASVATCQRRVVRLKATGVISKEVALVDASLVGRPLVVLCEVTLTSQAHEYLTAFESLMNDAQQVQQCYRLGAGPDFILIAFVSDMESYQLFASNYLTSRHGVRNVRTFFATQVSKFKTSVPITSHPSQG